MAVYKVPQDVEADDKLIGPFTFKQFVFIIVTVGFLYLTFLAWQANPVFVVIPFIPALFFGILGLWPRRDQPIEIYLLAIARFWLKPRKRIWSQEGQTEHVRITAPLQNMAHQYTDGLSRGEVQNRLKILAANLDSQGWAVKNVPSPMYGSAAYGGQDESDRLVMPEVLTPEIPESSLVSDSEDMFDLEHNPLAQKFDDLSKAAVQHAREEAISHMTEQNDTANPAKLNYDPYPEDIQQSVIQPLGHSQSKEGGSSKAKSTKTESTQESTEHPQPSPAILKQLAQNSDLNISTLARQAEQALHDEDVIEFH